MCIRLLFALAATAAALTGAPAAQSPAAVPAVHVGDGTISGARLVPYENAWLMSVHTKDGRVVDQGIWTDLLRQRDTSGRKEFVRTQGMTYQKGATSYTINVFDPVTLAPITSERRGPDGKVTKRAFDGAHVETQTSGIGTGEAVNKDDLPTAVYDFNGGMYGLLLATQQLRAGLMGSLPAVAEFDNGYRIIPYRVIGREKVRAGSRGEVDAWIVETGDPPELRFWVSEEAPYIIRLVIPGKQYDIVYEMIK